MISIPEGIQHVIDQLDQEDIEYAKANGGFSALHDLCDANMLLPHVDDDNFEVTKHIDYYNAIMDGVTVELI